MVADGEGIDHRVRFLDVLTQERVKVVLVDTLALPSAVETPQAATLKRVFRQIDQPGREGIDRLEVGDHIAQVLIVRLEISHNDCVEPSLLFCSGQGRCVLYRRTRHISRCRFADIMPISWQLSSM